jgi:hypothetical protein
MNAISRLQRPLAIAMWDTGWLTRHYPHGSFADWDKTLDELVARGYDAIRIETFPHLVAAGSDGVVQERFFRPRGGGLEHMWRNPWSLYLEPRSALAEFLPKCRARGVKVGLATWFPNVSENRHKQVQGADEFVRVWHETLTFLDGSGLLDNVIYVDLLNEYPLWHGFEWLNLMLESLWHRGRTGGSPARTNDVCPSPDTAVRKNGLPPVATVFSGDRPYCAETLWRLWRNGKIEIKKHRHSAQIGTVAVLWRCAVIGQCAR